MTTEAPVRPIECYRVKYAQADPLSAPHRPPPSLQPPTRDLRRRLRTATTTVVPFWGFREKDAISSRSARRTPPVDTLFPDSPPPDKLPVVRPFDTRPELRGSHANSLGKRENTRVSKKQMRKLRFFCNYCSS